MDTTHALGRNGHLLARAFNVPVAITEEKFHVVAAVLLSRLGVEHDFAPEAASQQPSRAAFQRAERRGAVAVIPVTGTLVHRAMALPPPVSGLTSYASILQAFDQAMEDPSVETVLLDVDSPGGEVNGAFDLSEHVYQARGEGKEIVALVDESAFSAAYAIASAAHKVIVPRTGGVGSIGVMAVHLDQSALNEKLGVKFTPVYAGARKNDLSPHAPLSKEALADLKARVEAVNDLFVDLVARNRGVDAKTVRAMEAAKYFGREAVDAGLATDVQAVADYVKAIGIDDAGASRRMVMSAEPQKPAAVSAQEPAKSNGEPESNPSAVADAAKPKAEVIDLEAFRKEHLEKGRADGEKVERERAKAITDICMLGKTPELAAELIAGGLTLDDARRRVLAAAAARSPEIFSGVEPLRAGGLAMSPVLADAERRVLEAKKRKELIA